MKKKEGGRGLLEFEVTYKAEMINTADFLNTKCIEYQFINIVKSQERSQPNMNSTITLGARIAEKLKELNENSDKKKETI